MLKMGKISVRVFKVDDNARIEIQDTGIGISKEELDVIFDEFRQLDSSETKSYKAQVLDFQYQDIMLSYIKDSYGLKVNLKGFNFYC